MSLSLNSVIFICSAAAMATSARGALLYLCVDGVQTVCVCVAWGSGNTTCDDGVRTIHTTKPPTRPALDRLEHFWRSFPTRTDDENVSKFVLISLVPLLECLEYCIGGSGSSRCLLALAHIGKGTKFFAKAIKVTNSWVGCKGFKPSHHRRLGRVQWGGVHV